MLPNELPEPFLKYYSALSPTAKTLLDINGFNEAYEGWGREDSISSHASTTSA